jgi:hypothetical protein
MADRSSQSRPASTFQAQYRYPVLEPHKPDKHAESEVCLALFRPEPVMALYAEPRPAYAEPRSGLLRMDGAGP